MRQPIHWYKLMLITFVLWLLWAVFVVTDLCAPKHVDWCATHPTADQCEVRP